MGFFINTTRIWSLELFLCTLKVTEKCININLPALLFGCEAAPLSSSDIERLDARQASLIKAALGLPRTARHTGLLRAAGCLVSKRRCASGEAVLRAFKSVFCSDNGFFI